MSLLNSFGQFNTTLQVGGAAASLVGATKALLKPKNPPPGIEGFIFDIPETETVKLQAQVTHHFAEDNYALQDHIAFEPITVTLTGLIGELVVSKSELEQYAKQVLDRLGPLGLLSPSFSSGAAQYLAEINRLKSAAQSTLKQIKSLGDVFGFAVDSRTAQQQAYDTLTQMYYGRSLVHCETPWRTFGPRENNDENYIWEVTNGSATRTNTRVAGSYPMIIESLEFFQDTDTKDMTKVTVTLREFRTVSTTAGRGTLKNRAKAQAKPKAPKGKVKGENNSIGWTAGNVIGG
jgi:hypothetical protein